MKNNLRISMDQFKIILIVIFSLIITNSFAQTECEDKIQKAEKLYEDGKYDEVVNTLLSVKEDCKLDRAEKAEVLKYLAASYYELDELEEADKYMEQFIKKNQAYKANINSDPYAFRQELEKFKSWPQFYVGLSGGIPVNKIIIEKIYPVLDSATANYNQEFISKKAFSAMFTAGWNINQYFSLNTGFGISLQTLSQSIPMYSGLSFTYEESNTEFNLPVFFKFSYPLKNKIIPSIYLGVEMIQIYDAEYSYNYTQIGDIDEDYQFLLLPRRQKSKVPINIERDRTTYRTAAIAGVGIGYELNRFVVQLNFKYRQEQDLYNNKQAHYSDPNLYLTNNYVLPDFKIESYELTIGFFINLNYKVKSKY